MAGAGRFARGSEWRKWDLHTHSPGTKMADAYKRANGGLDWRRFCKAIHESGVAAVAIADYFSLDGYFNTIEKYHEYYPEDSSVLFLPNLELRLNVAVNKAGQAVNLHLVFNPTLTRERANRFLGNLYTEGTTGRSRAKVSCLDLDAGDDFESATVSLASIDKAIEDTFGVNAIHPNERQKHLLVVASAKGDGIRPGGSGSKRKFVLSDEIDKFSDAFFSNAGSREYFLDTGRLESSESIRPKPVLDGCDAHNFDDLENWLGRNVEGPPQKKNLTWIKADVTYEGLLQTLIEPASRVAIQPLLPDAKDPYKVISKITFAGTEDFPPEIVFNRNLNSIIGSRSSGKSTLLAHISHAVDPVATVRIQADLAGGGSESSCGPAAGKTWDEVSGVECHVVWESGEATAGKVIYVPQNALYSLSEREGEITRKIQPTLFRAYPQLKGLVEGVESALVATNAEIDTNVREWFVQADQIRQQEQDIRALGDPVAIAAERDRIAAAIEHLKESGSLGGQEVNTYQLVVENLGRLNAILERSEEDFVRLSRLIEEESENDSRRMREGLVEVKISVLPKRVDLPSVVADSVDSLVDQAQVELRSKIQNLILESYASSLANKASITFGIFEYKSEYSSVLSKGEASQEVSILVAEHKRQVDALAKIRELQEVLVKSASRRDNLAASIERDLEKRGRFLEEMVHEFDAEDRWVGDIRFGVEIGVSDVFVESASESFSRRGSNSYIPFRGGPVDYSSAQKNPREFLEAVWLGLVPLNKGKVGAISASSVLTVVPEIRFTAEMDSDRIGGFSASSMTPGKQALFALTLILNEVDDPWPLLIDQPEDDLDSRSIYETIVPYLIERKAERQIIMVSHNANLVIGADSECVIVANRHGGDRPNHRGRMFEYLSGSLEFSKKGSPSSGSMLARMGVREHACAILDGGAEAFEKRRGKYNI